MVVFDIIGLVVIVKLLLLVCAPLIGVCSSIGASVVIGRASSKVSSILIGELVR